VKMNARQREVVEHNGHIVTAAPPGSGKTRVLIERTQRLLRETKGQIKLVTFTKAAAEEMKKRIGGSGQSRVEAATFDSYCYRMYRKSGGKLQPPNGLDEYRAKQRICEGGAFGVDFETFDETLAKASTRLDPSKAPKAAVTIYRKYCEILNGMGKTDFASIARKVVQELQSGGKIKPLVVENLLVDEFQDADEIQLAWVLAHAKAGAQVMVVGDDDQSIYGWRGGLGYAAMKTIETQLKAKVILLDTCYRCRPEVVEHSRLLIGHNTERFHKPIIAVKPAGGQVEWWHVGNADAAIDLIHAKLQALGNPKFAVLARRNVDLDKPEGGLGDYRIMRLGGKPFWSNPGATAVLELMEFLVDRDRLDCLDAFLEFSKISDQSAAQLKQCLADGYIGGVGGELITGTPERALAEILVKHPRMETDEQQVEGLRSLDLHVSHLADKSKKYIASKTAVEAIVDRLKRSDHGLPELIKSIKAANKRKRALDDQDVDGTVCTMHAAKGKEWPVVFVVCANQGISPNGAPPNPDEEDLAKRKKSLDLLEEERRLFYVALTRAEDRVFVISYDAIGKKYGLSPSQFIDEAEILSEKMEQLIEQQKSKSGAAPMEKPEAQGSGLLQRLKAMVD